LTNCTLGRGRDGRRRRALPLVASLVAAVALVATAACSSGDGGNSGDDASERESPAVQLGGPGETNRPLDPDEADAATDEPDHSEADVTFVQDMIAHHGQALEMTALAAEHRAGMPLALMAERMDTSQNDEIDQFEEWLTARGEDVPPAPADGDAEAHESHDAHAGVPGMATPVELDELAAARGEAFDRLFLELMIRHHEGALLMVADLFAAGGGQESEAFALAQHVDADQRIEIARMRDMLADLG
jgi:uncharacterized protein (DUF305 family)